MTLEKTIGAVADPELLKRIPAFVRGHALSGTAKLIARDYPELAQKAETGTLSEADIEQLRSAVNDIFQERLKKHHL